MSGPPVASCNLHSLLKASPCMPLTGQQAPTAGSGLPCLPFGWQASALSDNAWRLLFCVNAVLQLQWLCSSQRKRSCIHLGLCCLVFASWLDALQSSFGGFQYPADRRVACSALCSALAEDSCTHLTGCLRRDGVRGNAFSKVAQLRAQEEEHLERSRFKL